MKRLALLILFLLALATSSFSDNTHSTGNPQQELGHWFGDSFTPFLFSGCTPAVPSSSLTFAAFACAGYVRGTATELVYVTQPAVTLTLANTTGNHWIALHHDTSTVVSGWTRRSGSHYLFRQASTQPATPDGGLIITKAAVAGGVITTVVPISGRNGPVPLNVVSGAYSAKDFGMTGDGSDVTQQFTQALATLPTAGIGGGKIVFPIGTYVVSSTISLKDRRNITLECATVARRAADSQSCTIQYTAASGSLLTFEGATGIAIRGFNLAYTNAAYAGIFIDLDQGTGVQNTSEILFEDNRIGGLSTSSKTASSLVRAAELVYDVSFHRNVFQNGTIGILGSQVSVINSNAIKISENLFLGGFGTAHILGGGAGWSVWGNTFEPYTAAVAGSFDTATPGIRGLMYHGNWHGDASSGTWIKATGGILNGASFVGNDIQGTGTTVCLALGASTGVQIMGNRLECAANSIDLGTAAAVTVLSNTKTNTMVSNLATAGITSLVQDAAATRLYLTGLGIDFDRAETGQTNAKIRARNDGTVNSFEWGLANAAGFASTMGAETGTGRPFVCLNCEAGTTLNTYQTRGKVGSLIQGDLLGGIVFGKIATASADNQAVTPALTITTAGQLLAVGQAQASLGTPANGTITFCTDCAVTSGADNTCAGAGNGALAVRINSVWRCFIAQN